MSLSLCSMASAQSIEKDSLSESKIVLKEHIKQLLNKQLSKQRIAGTPVSQSKYERLRKLLIVDSTATKVKAIPGKKVSKEVYEHVKGIILSNSVTKNQ